MAQTGEKDFPSASDGIRGLLNMEADAKREEQKSAQQAGAPPENLPFMENIEQPVSTIQTTPPQPVNEGPIGGPAPAGHTGPVEQITTVMDKQGNEWLALGFNVVKTIAPYAIIFIICLALYSFYFSDFSFYSLFNSDRLRIEDVAEKHRNKALDELKQQSQKDYDKWMRQFFFDVNDESITAMDTDVSGNGLNNFEKYLLNLNPKIYSTRGNMSDGQYVIQGLNPWTGKEFTEDQKNLIEKYMDKETINNRLAAAVLTRGVTKYAQYVTEDSPYYIDPQTFQEIRQDNPVLILPGATSSGSGGGNANPAATQHRQQQGVSGRRTAQAAAPIDNGTAINKAVPGRLDIPANKISVPIIWTKNIADFDADLRKGIVHYPGTAMPGDMGTSYISGHSSGYLWDRNPYKQVFAALGQVKDGTSFSITAQQMNGKTVVFHYVVERRGEYAADDQSQFVSTANSVVALSTCWPVGTTDRRLVLFGRLSQTQRN